MNPQTPEQPGQPVQGVPAQAYPPQPGPMVTGQYPQGASPQPGVMPPAPGQPVATAPKTNPNSTQNTLQIAEIRDGIVIMNDGSFRSVVMVRALTST